MSAQPVDVLLRYDVLIHTLPLLVADANKAGANLTADRTVSELREARAAVAELIAACEEELAANDEAGVKCERFRAAIARVQGGQP